jgi:hypothetical protein
MMLLTLGYSERKEVIGVIKRLLGRRDEIVFAYLHGSFLTGSFRDVDVALYLRERGDVFCELQFEAELEEAVRLPVDVRILNSAPLSFRFAVVKNGVLLFSRDEAVRSDFEASTIAEYHDFGYYRRRYRREALGI